MKHLKFWTTGLMFLLVISSVVFSQTGGVESCISDFFNQPPPKREGVTRAVFSRSKKWLPGQPIRVKFLDGDPVIQQKVVGVSRTWEQYANIHFVYVPSGEAEIRITFKLEGYWSLVGTDSTRMSVVKTEEGTTGIRGTSGASMNLQFTLKTPDIEIRRLVLHEFGHALGLNHEHQNLNRTFQWNDEAVYEEYQRTQGWSREKIKAQVIDRYGAGTELTNGKYDPISIMHYPVDPALTKGGFKVGWNTVLSENDKVVIGQMYPFSNTSIKTNEQNPGGNTPKPTPTTPANNVAIAFQAADIEWDVTDTKTDTDGMNIVLDFRIDNALNEPMTVGVIFFYADGAPLKDSNQQYYSVNGQVASWRKITPAYQQAVYKQFKIFIPYDELELECGDHNLKYFVGIWKGNQRIATTGYSSFEIEEPCN